MKKNWQTDSEENLKDWDELNDAFAFFQRVFFQKLGGQEQRKDKCELCPAFERWDSQLSKSISFVFERSMYTKISK